MPEGDTIHYAARRVGGALVGREILAIETPQPRHGRDRWPQRLSGRAVSKVDARGKHLFIRFDGGLTLHSHLRRARFDQRLAGLGADVLAADFDEGLFLTRLREDDPTRGIGDALLDQHNLAGFGNVWKSEACFLAGVDPWRALRDLSDGAALEIVRGARPLIQRSAERGGRIVTFHPERRRRERYDEHWVYDRAGLPCRRCEARIRARGQGDDNRTTYWCPGCQT